MRFYSRVVFICNCCFLVAIILWGVESKRRTAGNYNAAIGYQPLEASLVILGYSAIFLNLFFLLFCVYRVLIKKIKPVPRWIVRFNILVFPVQIYFHFFSH